MTLLKLLFCTALLAALGLSQPDDCDTLEKCQETLKGHPESSLIRFRLGEIYLAQHSYVNSANKFREAVNGDGDPKWTKVWALINLGKVFDITNQRERSLNQYRLALETKDNTRGALDEARKYIENPYRPN